MSMAARFLAVALMALIAGCNTVEGIGRDISGGARTMRDAL